MKVVIDQVQAGRRHPRLRQEVRRRRDQPRPDRAVVRHRERHASRSSSPASPARCAAPSGSRESGGTTTETVEMEIKVSIPLVGGKIESLIADLLRKALKAENAVGRALPGAADLWRSRSPAAGSTVFAALTLVVYAVVFTALVAAGVRLLDSSGTALVVVLLALARALAAPGRRSTSSPGRGCAGSTPRWRCTATASSRGRSSASSSCRGRRSQSAAVERRWIGRRLRIRLVPPSDPRHARHRRTHGSTRDVRGRSNASGLRYSLRVLDIGVDELREAFVVQSGGRVSVG